MKLSNRLTGTQIGEAASQPAAVSAYPAEHIVQFYESDDHLVRSIADFFNERLAQGGAAIILATPEHRDGVELHLRHLGHDIALLRQTGRYTAVDAEEKLGCLLAGEKIDEAAFYKLIGGLIAEVSKGVANVVIFGELVALLVKQNRAKQAIRLEQLWNQLATTRRFSLLCAYPMKSFAEDANADVFTHVCHEHTRVVPVENYDGAESETHRLRSIAQMQRSNASYEAKLAEHREVEQGMAAEISELQAFCHTVSHDMRSPLRAIQSAAANLLQEHAMQIGSAGVQELQRIERATIRLQTLIRDVLAYTKASYGEFELKPISLPSFLKELIADHPELQRMREAVTLDLVAEQVKANEASLAQCFVNLMTNAVKFVPNGTDAAIRVRSERVGNMVKISVTDNGIGIKPEHRDRIFQVFGRVYSASEFPGTGIGLVLVKKAALRMGGDTGFDSEYGKGSTFWFTVPSAEAHP